MWLRFRGGKGVATALGVLAVLEPLAALAGFGIYAILFALWRVSNAWQRAVRTALEPWGLTHAQVVVLATLDWVSGNSPSGQAKQHEVAGLAGMDPMTTSATEERCEQPECPSWMPRILSSRRLRPLGKCNPSQ